MTTKTYINVPFTANNFDLAVPFPEKPFESFDEFEIFIFANGIGFWKDNLEEFIDWCANKYYALTGIDMYEML